MQRQMMNIAVLIALSTTAVGFIILTIALLNRTNVGPDIVIGWITGGLIPFVALVYSQIKKRSVRFFLFTHKVKSIFFPKVLNWSISASFKGEHINSTYIDESAIHLTKLRSGKTKVITKKINKINSIVLVEPGPSIDLRYYPASENDDMTTEINLPSLYMTINNYRIGYNQVTRVISDEIVPVLEILNNTINGTETLYNFTIDFDKSSNPFYGWYIKNIPSNVTNYFLIQINIHQQGKVIISDSKISITSQSQFLLYQLAMQFLTFDSSLGEHLQYV